MKLTTLLLIIALVQVSAKGFSQITLTEKNAPVKKIIKAIEKQTGYVFVYDEAKVKLGSVSVDLHNATINDALTQCFKGFPVTFQIIDKNIVLQPKVDEPTLFDKIKSIFSAIDVTGHILNEQGQPIAGATVTIKNTDKIAVTDATGRFEIKGVDEHAVIVITCLGYVKRELPAAADIGNIWMVVATNQLDAVQVIGYGETTRRLSTGNVSSVSAKEIDQQPISNPILGLEGRVPGVFITQTAGYSGAQFNIQIRGQNSFAGLDINNSAPLYVIDGIPFYSKPVEQSAGTFGGNGLSPLNTLDPTNIETIDILKDADATAIFGSRGANGVVLITTKKGKAGNTKVNVDISSGFGDVSHTIPLMGIDQYLSIRRQAFANDAIINPAITPTTTNAPDLTLWNQHANTDFTKLEEGNTQHQTKATFDLSGGDQYTQFLFGGNYRHESTVLATSTADDAVQFHLNMQHHSHDNKFGVSASVSYVVDNNTIPNISLNYNLPPNYPLYNSNGSLYWGGNYTNPLAAVNATYGLKSTNMIANASLHYMIIPGLDLKINAGYNYDNVFGTTISPVSAANPASNPTPTVTLNNNYIKTYIAEPQATYTHTWGKGKLTAIVGGTWQETQNIQPYFILGIYTNIQLATNLGSTNVLLKSSAYQDYKYDSGFGRVEYAWDGKYLFSGNIRRDGSSRFGPDKAFGNFGSGAFAWIFSKENFITDNLPWLSFGKLKTSYGSVGNDKTLQNYAYLSTYSASSTPYGTITPLAPSGIANPYLQWEQTIKLDVAMELGFIHDRIFFSADLYRNRTSHLLASTALPSQDGFSFISSANLPDGAIVQNHGIELELSTVNIKNKGFSWTTSFNFTVPQNKLLAFPNILSSNYANTYVVGQSLNLRTVYHSTGFVNGVPTVQDVNGDGVITSGYSATGKSDYIVDGNSDPKFYGGVNNTFSYKGIQLDFLFQFVKRTAQRGGLLGYPGAAGNLAQSITDLPFKYSATNGAAYPTSSYSYYTLSDAAIQDASFLRLKNVSLSYNVPQVWAKRFKMSALQVYLHAQNLLTFTPYKGADPETLSSTVPTLRMMIAGIKTTF